MYYVIIGYKSAIYWMIGMIDIGKQNQDGKPLYIH